MPDLTKLEKLYDFTDVFGGLTELYRDTQTGLAVTKSIYGWSTRNISADEMLKSFQERTISEAPNRAILNERLAAQQVAESATTQAEWEAALPRLNLASQNELGFWQGKQEALDLQKLGTEALKFGGTALISAPEAQKFGYTLPADNWQLKVDYPSEKYLSGGQPDVSFLSPDNLEYTNFSYDPSGKVVNYNVKTPEGLTFTLKEFADYDNTVIQKRAEHDQGINLLLKDTLPNWTAEAVREKPVGFIEAIRDIGRWSKTETLVRQFYPNATPQELDELFTPLPQGNIEGLLMKALPLQVKASTLDWAIPYFEAKPDALRAVMIAEGRNANTEALVRTLYPDIAPGEVVSYFDAEAMGRDKIAQQLQSGELKRNDWLAGWGNWTIQVASVLEATKATRLFGGGQLLDNMWNRGKDWQIYATPLETFTFDKVFNPSYLGSFIAQQGPTMAFVSALTFGVGGLAAAALRPVVAATVARVVPVVAGRLGLGVTATTKLGAFAEVALGSMGAGASMNTINAGISGGQAWERAKGMGLTDMQAQDAANQVFLNSFKLLAGEPVQAVLLFTPLKTASLMARGLVTTARVGGMALTAAGFNVAQEGLIRQALGEKFQMDDDMKSLIAISIMQGLTMGAIGELYTRTQNRVIQRLSPESRIIFEQDINNLKAQGLDQKAATNQALDNVVKTKEGQTITTKVAQEINREQLINQIKPKSPVDAVVVENLKEQIRTQAADAAHDTRVAAGWRELAEGGKVPPGLMVVIDDINGKRYVNPTVLEEVPNAPLVNQMTAEMVKALGMQEGVAQAALRARVEEQAIPKVTQEPGMPEAGAQPEMFGGETKVVRPEGKGKIVQISMEDQLKLEQARQAAGQPEVSRGAEEATSIREFLATDPIATAKFKRGGKNVGIEAFISIREQSFPEYFTVKDAETLMPGHNFSEYATKGTKEYNHVPRDVVLDDLSKRFNMTPDQFAEKVMQIHEQRQRAIALEKTAIAETPVAPAEVGKGPLSPLTKALAAAEVKTVAVAETLSAKLTKAKQAIQDLRQQKVITEQVKKTLVDTIKENLPLHRQGELLTKVKNVKTQADLTEALTRVDEIVEQSAQIDLRAEITAELKKTNPKKVSGVVQGKYTADIQELLDTIKHNLDIDRQKALDQIEKNINDYNNGRLSQEDMARQNEFVNYAGIKQMSASQLSDMLDFIKTIKEYGRAGRLEIIATRKAERTAVETAIVNEATGGKGLKPGAESLAAEAEIRRFGKVTGWLERVKNVQYSIWDLGSKLNRTKAQFKDTAIYDFLRKNVYRARNSENASVQAIGQEVRAKAQEVFGTKKQADINRIFSAMFKDKMELGTFKNTEGTDVTLKFTKGQIIKKYQELQDPTLTRTFDEGMHWTQEMKDAITKSLTAPERAWADFQMEWYQKYYEAINKVYREEYGVDLPHNRNYSPISRDFDIDVPEDMLVYKDLQRYASVLNGSLKSRVSNMQPLKATDANATFINHIMQMEHFKAWSQPMHTLRSVFGSKEVRQAILQYHGKDILDQIDLNLNRIAAGGVEKSQVIRGFDALRGNFSTAVIGLKPYQMLQQLPTVFSYLTDMKLPEFVRGVADFWKNPIENYKWLMENSSYIRDRYTTGFERDIHTAMQMDKYKRFTGGKNIRDWAYFMMTSGDKFGVMQGFWAKYKAGLSKGLSQARALEEAGLSTDRSQNTSAIDTLSSLQSGGTFWKLLTMFQTQPNKYFRIIAENMRDIRYGRANRPKAIANIAIAWVVLPAIFQAIADGFQFKKERQLRAVALGPINDLLAMGQISQTVTDWITGENFDYQPTPIMAPVRDLGTFIQKALALNRKRLDPYADITIDDVTSFIEGLAKPVGEIVGVPTPYLIQVERAIRSGDLRQLVFTQWALEEPNPSLQGKTGKIIDQLGDMIIEPNAAADKIPTAYSTKDAFSELRTAFAKTLPSDVTEKAGYDKRVVAAAQAIMSLDTLETFPNKQLYEIVDDIASDTSLNYTFTQYYLDWQTRSKIKSLAELKTWDKEHPRYNLGNVTPAQYSLMLQYEGLTTKADKEKFIADHPEMSTNGRTEWLKANPEANANLALHGQAPILTKEAYNQYKNMAKTLGYPAGALPLLALPPETSLDTHFAYEQFAEQGKQGSWEAQLLLKKDAEAAKKAGVKSYVQWRTDGGEPLQLSETPIASLEIKTDPKFRTIYDQIEGLTNRLSPDYMEDATARDAAVGKLKSTVIQGTFTYLDTERKIQAIEKGTDQKPTVDTLVTKHVEFMKMQDAQGVGSSTAEVMLYRVDNPDYNTWRMDTAIWGAQALQPIDTSSIPVWRIDAQWRQQDTAYDAIQDPNERMKRLLREDYLKKNPDYAVARLQRDAYGMKLDQANVSKWVEYNQLPDYGYWRERYRMNNPDFDKLIKDTMTKAGQNPWADIDPKKIPAEQYDQIYEQFKPQFEAYDNVSGTEVEREAKRKMMLQGNDTFWTAYLQRAAYAKFVPEKYVDTYADYYKLLGKGKAQNYEAMNRTDLWYEDDWYLIEHYDFYKEVYVGVLGNQTRDFTKVPERAVFDKYLTYVTITATKSREQFRLDNPDLDAWGVRKFGWTPIASQKGAGTDATTATSGTTTTTTPSKKGTAGTLGALEQQGLLDAFLNRFK